MRWASSRTPRLIFHPLL
jgi:hypothetical protein